MRVLKPIITLLILLFACPAGAGQDVRLLMHKLAENNSGSFAGLNSIRP